MSQRPQANDVQRLAKVRAPWCVTIYGDTEAWTRGNHRTETAGVQIRAAVKRLRLSDAPKEVVEAIQAHLEQACSWSGSAAGRFEPHTGSVAIYATEDGAELFVLTGHPEPVVQVGDRFLMAPVLDGVFPPMPPVLALAMSAKEVRLLDVGSHPARAIDVPGLPTGLAETIALDLTGDRDTWAHLRISEDHKERLREYARAIDRSVEPLLRQAGALLVIAAAEPLASIYRGMSSHRLVASSVVVGNHDGVSPDAVADLAAPVIDQYRRDVISTHLTRLADAPDRALVLADVDAIAHAARDGAINTLFVDVHPDGSVSEDALDGPSAPDPVEEILGQALSSRATLVPVGSGELSGHGRLAALLRYAPVDAPPVPVTHSPASRGRED